MNTFEVFTNPWAAIDHKARPSGAVLMDPVEHYQGGGKYVGAKLVAVQTAPKQWRKVGKYVETIAEAEYDRVWSFSIAPVEIPSIQGRPSDYYLDRIRNRELIPADEACAAAAGVPFVESEVVILESRAARKAEWDSQHGEGSFESLHASYRAAAESQLDQSASRPEAAPASEEATQQTVAPKSDEISKE